MDTIKAENRKTKYCPDTHLAIVVNGQTLDSLIGEAYRSNRTKNIVQRKAGWLSRILKYFTRESNIEYDYEGAVPTWLDWFYTEIPSSARAKQVVWDRLDSIGDQPIIVPILMCPDDLDFFCFVLVAEIRCDDNTVRWERIGLDTSENRGDAPETLGEAVEWFDFIPPFVFRKDEFSECVETFRLALKQDFTEQTEI